MKLSRSTLSLALLAALVAPAAHAEIAIDVIGGSEVSFEGLVQADYNSFDNDFTNYNGDLPDGDDSDNELRRAELVLKGKGPGNIEWVLGYDAKDDKFLDANVKYKFGNNANHFIQVGQFKQPNSMEELSSTKNNDFVAKASITNTFGIARRVGVGYYYGDTNWGVNASYFSRELTRNRKHGNGFGLRGTWAPILESGNVLHFGLSHMDFDADLGGSAALNTGDTVSFSARPLADISQTLVSTGSITRSDRVATTGVEGLWVHGPFKLQGEYMKTSVKRYGASQDVDFDGGYISGLWNITGETWTYKSGAPVTGLPDNPAMGMWQVGLRYDTIDLNDGTGNVTTGATTGVLGGEQDAWTVGVNWYWRSNFKFMLNYVKVDSSKWVGGTTRRYVDDNPNITEVRMQFYW